MASISVIMPAHNAARTIQESIASILQEPQVTQLVVVDDLSTDKTREVIQTLHDSRLSLIRGYGKGIAAAFNCGLEATTGEFICRCDADDLYVSGRLAWQLAWLLHHPNIIAVSSGFRTITSHNQPVADLAIDGGPRCVTDQLLAGHAVTSFCTWLTRTAVIKKIGGAREWFATAEDLDLQFRLATQGDIYHLPKIAYEYRLHEHSITHTQGKNLRDFFETIATEFARQRFSLGHDQLEIGSPPALPEAPGQRISAADEISQQIVGKAWSQFATTKQNALKTLTSLIRTQPMRLSHWRHLGVMLIKIFRSYLARVLTLNNRKQ